MAVSARIALLPAPEGLPPYAGCSFAIVAGVIVGLIFIAAFLLIGMPWMALIRWRDAPRVDEGPPAPAASVAALLETSVLFATVIGTLVLKEAFGRQRALGAVNIGAGVIALRFV